MKLASLVTLLLISILTYGQTINVCTTCEFNDINSAYESSNPGDTILINGGEYYIDSLLISKPLTIIGSNNAHLISKTGKELIIIESSHVSLIGLKLSGVKTNYLHEDAAIRVRNVRHFLIKDNIISNCFFAIYLERTMNGTVEGNRIDGNASSEAESGNGIHAWYCDSILISSNYVSHQRDGIYLEFVNNSEVAGNHSHHNTRYGLHYMFSNDDTYKSNVFEYNGVGVAVMFSRRITMEENTFGHNWGHAAYGLLLKEIYDAEIINNKFIQNTIGIFVEGSNRINYTYNEFRRNGWAIKFSGGCELNMVTRNHFLHNSIDLVVSSKLNDNSFDHNYWSEYTGYDLDKDGIGDIPHYPVKLYSYILNQAPESIVLIRSLFVDIINFAEKISPVFTPKDVLDYYPQMVSKL